MFNNGHHARDFTYIDDVVEGVLRTADRIPQPNPEWNSAHPDPATSSAPYAHLQHRQPQARRADALHRRPREGAGREAKKNFLPLQPGDVPATFADVDDLVADVGFAPSTPIEEGIARFVDWYRDYYKA